MNQRKITSNPSAPTIPPPQDRLLSTPSILLSFSQIFALFVLLKERKNTKSGRVWPIPFKPVKPVLSWTILLPD